MNGKVNVVQWLQGRLEYFIEVESRACCRIRQGWNGNYQEISIRTEDGITAMTIGSNVGVLFQRFLCVSHS